MHGGCRFADANRAQCLYEALSECSRLRVEIAMLIVHSMLLERGFLYRLRRHGRSVRASDQKVSESLLLMAVHMTRCLIIDKVPYDGHRPIIEDGEL